MIQIPDYISALQPYKAGGTIETIKARFGLDQIIKLASNENPFGPVASAITAMQKAASQVHRYPDAGGEELRNKLADYYGIKPDHIVLGSGSEGVMLTALRAFLADDDEILTSEGAFVGFRIMAKASGHKLITIPMINYQFDLDAMANAINKKTKIIYLTNPNNPTGTIFTKNDLDTFITKVPDHSLIIIDEAYFEFAIRDQHYPNSMMIADNVLTVRTFSKAHGLAGARIGYGIAHPQLISHLLKVKLPFEPNLIAQAGALAAMDEMQTIQNYVKTNEIEKTLFYDLFEESGISYLKSNTNFVMLLLKAADRVDRLHDLLLRKGIMTRPLTGFGFPDGLRISIGTPNENQIFFEKFKRSIEELKAEE